MSRGLSLLYGLFRSQTLENEKNFGGGEANLRNGFLDLNKMYKCRCHYKKWVFIHEKEKLQLIFSPGGAARNLGEMAQDE